MAALEDFMRGLDDEQKLSNNSGSMRVDISGGGREGSDNLEGFMRSLNSSKSKQTKQEQGKQTATMEPWKVSPEVQKLRDQGGPDFTGRMQFLQQDLVRAKKELKAGNPRAQGDIDAINRDIAKEKAKQSSVNTSAKISGGQPAPKQQPQQQVTAPSDGFTGARNRAGQPVTETGDIVTGALGGLARTIGGAAHGAATQLLGGAGDINQLIVNHVGSAFPNAPALPTTKRLQELSPIAPQSQEGKVAQELGQFIPVPGLKGGSKVANALGEQFAKKAAPIAERVEPTMGAVTPEEAAQATQVLNAPKTAANQPVMAGVGAAETDPISAYHAELASATPDVQKRFSHVPASEQNLKALQAHNKFAKFDMVPTEGEALQDTHLMSQEYNERAKDPAMMARLEERDPKLIQGFEKIKDAVAPDVYESNPVNLANAALEKLKANDVVREKQISKSYEKLKDANGGQFPMDGKAFADNAIAQLHHELVFEATPPVLKKALENFANGAPMTFENFERLRTITATEMRKGGTEAFTAGVIRDALENMPLSQEASALKPLADKARSQARARKKLIESNPAIKAAISDTRTADEIAAGIPHPAANTFIDKFYSDKTPETNLQRLKQELGEGSSEHQGLNSAVIENIKRKSGVVDNKGSVSQAALNKQLHNIYGNNLDVMLGKEGANYFRDLGDVARMSEHAKGKHFVNTSNTEVVAEQNRTKQVVKDVASLVGHSVAAKATGGAYPALAIGFKAIKERNAAKTAEAAAKAEAAAIEKRRAERLSGVAGTKLSDIGK